MRSRNLDRRRLRRAERAKLLLEGAGALALAAAAWATDWRVGLVVTGLLCLIEAWRITR